MSVDHVLFGPVTTKTMQLVQEPIGTCPHTSVARTGSHLLRACFTMFKRDYGLFRFCSKMALMFTTHHKRSCQPRAKVATIPGQCQVVASENDTLRAKRKRVCVDSAVMWASRSFTHAAGVLQLVWRHFNNFVSDCTSRLDFSERVYR